MKGAKAKKGISFKLQTAGRTLEQLLSGRTVELETGLWVEGSGTSQVAGDGDNQRGAGHQPSDWTRVVYKPGFRKSQRRRGAATPVAVQLPMWELEHEKYSEKKI